MARQRQTPPPPDDRTRPGPTGDAPYETIQIPSARRATRTIRRAVAAFYDRYPDLDEETFLDRVTEHLWAIPGFRDEELPGVVRAMARAEYTRLLHAARHAVRRAVRWPDPTGMIPVEWHHYRVPVAPGRRVPLLDALAADLKAAIQVYLTNVRTNTREVLFLRSVLGKLPHDQAVVHDHLSPADLTRLYREAEAQAFQVGGAEG